MAEKNLLARVVSKVNKLPETAHVHALSLALGNAVKFAGTASVRVEKLTENVAVLSIKNKKKVQNHIGGIHAAAMALLAESATGFLVAMNVPDSRVPVIKSLKVDYHKRVSGDLRAVARLSDEQIEQIRSSEKGEVTVAVTITDSEGKEPIECTMIWAWVPKVRKAVA